MITVLERYFQSLTVEGRTALAADIISKNDLPECESYDDLMEYLSFCTHHVDDEGCYLMWVDCTLVPILTQVIEHSTTDEAS